MQIKIRFEEIMENPTVTPLAIFYMCGQVRDFYALSLLFVQGRNRVMGVAPGAIPARKSSTRMITSSSTMGVATEFCSVDVNPPFVPPITLLPKSPSECRLS